MNHPYSFFPQLNAKADCTLIALDRSITREALTNCSRFLSLEYREPLQHMPSVTLEDPYLPESCPSVVLYPSELRADLQGRTYSCSPGYRYNSPSFKCIEGDRHPLSMHGSSYQSSVPFTFHSYLISFPLAVDFPFSLLCSFF